MIVQDSWNAAGCAREWVHAEKVCVLLLSCPFLFVHYSHLRKESALVKRQSLPFPRTEQRCGVCGAVGHLGMALN